VDAASLLTQFGGYGDTQRDPRMKPRRPRVKSGRSDPPLMRAVICDSYGPAEILRLEEIVRPVPKDDEVLVRIHATTVNRSDAHNRAGSPLITRFFHGLRRPNRRIPGSEFAGEIAETGADVTEFDVGDRVFGVYPFFGVTAGSHAEYMCIPERAPIVHMPDELTFEEATAVPDGAVLALGCLRRVGLEEGQRILVYGASGSIGTAAVQWSRYFGAHVTAVCNTKNLELVRSLGADEVIDYTREDFTKNGQTYDVVFDAVGKHSYLRCRRSLKPGGKYIPTDRFVNFLWAAWTWKLGRSSVVFDIPPHYRKVDLLLLRELLEAGQYRPVIDRRYPLEDVVEATKYVETQQKTGNVVLTVAP
jgi:NADPH:quinone reductase-like Zn-dependent oxidoreductase